jgi:single-strand DNA-binding protein
MAGSYNKVLLMGNLTRDPEVKHTSSNQALVNFGLAVNRKFKTSSGEFREEVTFVDCEAWGYTAENIGKFFAKGRPIFVEGRLKLDTWEDRNDGSKKSKLRVVVDNFQFVDSKPGGSSGGSGGGGGGYERAGASQQAPAEESFSNDDIPF